MNGRAFAIFIVGAAACAAVAAANDTELTYSGTPRMLNGNTTVSMRSEYVRMVIGEQTVTVDCRFTFVNRGPARKVRIGFPDEGGEPGSSLDPETGKELPPVPSITKFESWVGGRKVKTSVIPAGDDTGSFWHVKQVQFPANGTLEVRNRYTTDVGSSVAFSPASVSLAQYVLRTGASWRGNIGRSVVDVVFQRKSPGTPVVLRRLPDLSTPERHVGFAKTLGGNRRVVYYSGPCRPTVNGKTLRFVRTDWRPTKKDDVFLIFNAVRAKAEQGGPR